MTSSGLIVMQQELSIPFLLPGILQLIEAFQTYAGEVGTRVPPANAPADGSDDSADAGADACASRPKKRTEKGAGHCACPKPDKAPGSPSGDATAQGGLAMPELAIRQIAA
jgi:hypothetical protein